MTQTVLILGASGKIGGHAARAFEAAGWTVHRYTRGTDMTAAAMGAQVIVNGLNPPNYDNWETLLPALTTQVIDAAKASGATLILPGNVYNFGRVNGVIDDTTAQNAHTRKGRVRVRIERMYRESGVQTIVLRGGNFIDPEGQGDIMTLLVARSIGKGRLTAPGNPDVIQPYAYLPDMGRAMQMLADRRDSLARFEDVPFAGHAFSLTQLQAELTAASGRPIRMGRFPWWAVRLAAPVWSFGREFLEMRYLWDMGHTLSGDKLARLLPEFVPTPMAQVMRTALGPYIRPDQPMRTGGQTVGA